MNRREIDLIVIGGSAGSLDVLTTLLPALPRTVTAPVVVVVHLTPERPSQLAALLRNVCWQTVREAEDKEPLVGETVYLAPPDYHLFVERGATLSLSVDEKVNFSRPSIDVLFESAADAFGARVAGVLLSGANDDGARGMSKIKHAGGFTIAQSPESTTWRAMPAAAIALGVDRVLAPDAIAPAIAGLLDSPSVELS